MIYDLGVVSQEMYAEGDNVSRVNRLTPRQRRQVASLYGKAPKPMGTWEPLPSLTREETDVILKDFEQQTKLNKATQDHPEASSSWQLLDRDSQGDTVTRRTSHETINYNVTKTNSGIPRGVSSPSLPQRTNNYSIQRANTEYVQTGHGPPHSSSPHYHTQVHPHYQSIQSTQQPPSATEFRTSSNNWTAPHLSVYEQQYPQSMRAPSPSNTIHTQQYGPASTNNWTTTYESSVSSQLHPAETRYHSNTTVTQDRAPLPSCTTTLNRAPSPIRSSPQTTDYGAPLSTNWTRSSESVDYHSTQLMPLHSMSSGHSYSSQGDLPTPSSTPYGVSQLSSDMTSLGITLNPSSIEDVSSVNYSLLVVGVTGSGKSSACNFFIGNDVFNTAGGAIAITAKSDAHAQNIMGKKILFIDTPGFGDEFASDEVRMAELGRAILFAREGVNAIVLCMDGSRRFDSSIAQLLKEFEVLGAFWPYTFIMYTHAADMGNTEEEQRCKISQWLGNPKCPERMKWLFDKVCYRSMTVESKQFRNSSGYYQHKSQELLNMIETISAQNQHQRYTNQFFQWAKRKYDQVKQQKLEHERKLEETQKNLQSYQSILTMMEGDLRQKEQEHTDYVTRQQQYINSLEAQLRSCREEDRMRIQRQRAEAQQQLTYRAEDHQGFVSSCGASRERMLARYDEDSKQYREHEWRSRQVALELFLDELRFELYASNRDRRELNDKLVCMNAQLQKMEGGRLQPQQKQDSSYKTMAIEGAKFAAPYVFRTICSLM